MLESQRSDVKKLRVTQRVALIFYFLSEILSEILSDIYIGISVIAVKTRKNIIEVDILPD